MKHIVSRFTLVIVIVGLFYTAGSSLFSDRGIQASLAYPNPPQLQTTQSITQPPYPAPLQNQPISPLAAPFPDAALQPLPSVNTPTPQPAALSLYNYAGSYFYDTFVPTYSTAWIFTGNTELNTSAGHTDTNSLTLHRSDTAEIILTVPPNSNLTLSYWCRDEIAGSFSYPRHDLYLDGEDTTPGMGGSNISCGESWGQKVQTIGLPYTADGQVSIRFKGGNHFLPTRIGLDDILVEGTILPDDQAYSPNECPLCSNSETRHYVGGPIDSYSGNYNYETTDIKIPTIGNPLQFERTYNSHTNAESTAIGYGWTHNYDISLVFPNDSGGEEDTVILKAAHGSRLRFEDNGDGTYTPYPGIHANLTKSGNTYIVTTANQTTYTFDTSTGNPTIPRLLTLRDPKGNETAFTYTSDRLSKVTDPTGFRWLDFAYNGQSQLISVTDHTGRAIGYTYDTQDRLETVNDIRNLVWTYTYDGTSSLLHAVVNPEGEAVERTFYNGDNKAIRQENGEGQTVVEIAYSAPHLRAITEFGQTITDTYDVRGLLISQMDAEGNEQLYALDGNFNRTGIQDANNNQTHFVRDAFGYTTVITDAFGNDSQFTYDAQNNLTTLQDARDNITQYSYDGSNLITVTNPFNDTAVFTYNTSGQILTAQNERGYITRFGYDALGNMSAITDTLDNVTAFEYDNLGRLITTTNALNHITINAYDSSDNLIRVTQNYTPTQPQNYQNSYNLITEYSYDDANRPILVIDTLNRAAKYEYDLAGRLSRIIENYLAGQPQNYQNEYNLVTQYSYDSAGRQTLLTDTTGRQRKTIYNNRNLVERTINNYQDGLYDPAHPDEDMIVYYQYDGHGNLINTIDVLGRVTHADYDPLNRIDNLIQNYQPGSTAADANLTTHYQYDPTGNVRYLTNPLNQQTAYQYDPLNRLSTVIENYVTGTYGGIPDQDVTTSYQYDPASNRIAVIDANSHTTSYTFDALNRPIAIEDPLSNITEYGYDALGNQTIITDANSLTTLFSYDAGNRLTLIDYPDSTPDAAFTYNAVSNILTMDDGLSNPTSYQYDSLNRLTQINDSFNQTVTYQYDSLSRRTHLTQPFPTAPSGQATTIYNYDMADQLRTLTDWDGGQYQYSYDGANQLLGVAYPDGIETSYSYDGAGRLTDLVHQDGGRILTAYEYTLDKAGNRTQAIESLLKPIIPISPTGTYVIYLPVIFNSGPPPMPPSIVIDYNYDDLNRLTAAGYSDGQAFAYTYDPTGNRLTHTDNGTLSTYQYNDANRLTYVNGTAYSWDDNGNLLNDGSRTFTYDTANRLTQVVNGSRTTSFEYNGMGDRTRLWTNGVETQYLFDPVGLTQVLAEQSGGQSRYYLPGLAQYSSNGWEYQLPDPLGSVRQLVDPQGTVVLAQNYTPFGKLLEQVGTGQSGFGYTGEQQEPLTQLTYLRARYYDPTTGRFLTKDPFSGLVAQPATQHPYMYTGNNPILYVDPSGECRGLSGSAYNVCASAVMAAASGVNKANEYRQTIFFPGANTTFADRLKASTAVGGGSVLLAAGGVEMVGVLFGGGPLWTAVTGGGAACSTACADGDCTNEANLGLNSFSRASEFGIQNYNRLRESIRGTGLQAHHLIERRFAMRLGLNSRQMPSIALTPEEHQTFTNLWRGLLPYSNSNSPLNTTTATANDIWLVAQRIYADYPILLEAAKQTIFQTP